MLLMLFFLLLILILTFFCGHNILCFLNFKALDDEDHFILSIWSGLCLICFLCLTCNLFYGLNIIGLPVIFILSATYFIFSDNRQKILKQIQSLNQLDNYSILLSAIGISLLGSQYVLWADTELYHSGMINWMSEFGLVKGLALINIRYSLVSSWFSFASVFHTSILAKKMYAFPGIFCLFLIFLHLYFIIRKWLEKRNSIADSFAFSSYMIILACYIRVKGDRSIFISSTPDLPVILLTVIIMFTILVINKKNAINKEKYLIIFFSAVATTMKLSAAPLILFTIFYNICEARNKIKILLFSFFTTIVIISSFIIGGYKVSGYPLFPSNIISFNRSWAVEEESVLGFKNGVRDFAFFHSDKALMESNSSIEFIKKYTKRNQELILLLFLSLCSIFYIIIKKNIFQKDFYYPALLALGGIIYLLYFGPTLRFGLGYLIILPSMFFCIRRENSFMLLKKLNHLLTVKKASTFFLIFCFLYCSGILLERKTSSLNRKIEQSIKLGYLNATNNNFFLILPPPLLIYKEFKSNGKKFLENVTYVVQRSTILKVSHPEKGGCCYDSDLLCSHSKANLKLISEKKGFQGGFTNKD